MAVSFETRLGLDLLLRALPRTCCFGFFEGAAVLKELLVAFSRCRGLHLAVDSAHSTGGCGLSRIGGMMRHVIGPHSFTFQGKRELSLR